MRTRASILGLFTAASLSLVAAAPPAAATAIRSMPTIEPSGLIAVAQSKSSSSKSTSSKSSSSKSSSKTQVAKKPAATHAVRTYRRKDETVVGGHRQGNPDGIKANNLKPTG